METTVKADFRRPELMELLEAMGQFFEGFGLRRNLGRVWGVLYLSGERVDNAIGLDPDAAYHAYEFWTDTYLGKLNGRDRLERKLAPGHCAMISVRRALPHPQVLSTDRHLLQGWVDLKDVHWDAGKKSLHGSAKVIGGETFRIVLAGNGLNLTSVQVDSGSASLSPHLASADLRVLAIRSPETADVKWSVR